MVLVSYPEGVIHRVNCEGPGKGGWQFPCEIPFGLKNPLKVWIPSCPERDFSPHGGSKCQDTHSVKFEKDYGDKIVPRHYTKSANS